MLFLHVNPNCADTCAGGVFLPSTMQQTFYSYGVLHHALKYSTLTMHTTRNMCIHTYTHTQKLKAVITDVSPVSYLPTAAMTQEKAEDRRGVAKAAT